MTKSSERWVVWDSVRPELGGGEKRKRGGARSNKRDLRRQARLVAHHPTWVKWTNEVIWR